MASTTRPIAGTVYAMGLVLYIRVKLAAAKAIPLDGCLCTAPIGVYPAQLRPVNTHAGQSGKHGGGDCPPLRILRSLVYET